MRFMHELKICVTMSYYFRSPRCGAQLSGGLHAERPSSTKVIMFQDFSSSADPALGAERVARLRARLASLGVDVVAERVVLDGNVVTGGGVTAGIDFALSLTATELGEDVAHRLQLQFEYDPAPPFDTGSPEKADPILVEGIRGYVQASRQEIVARIAAKLER